MRSPLSSRRGASAVEFALTLPILITLIAALLEYSWYIQSLNAVVSATREGVRYGVTLDPAVDDLETEAKTMTETVLKGQGIDCDTAYSCTVTGTYDTSTYTAEVLTVTTSIEYVELVGLVPTPATLATNYTMAVQDQFD